MLDAEAVSEIRRLHYAERWKVGTIAAQLGVHPDAVKRALNRPSGPLPPRKLRPRITDPYVPFLLETLEQYPRLRSTVLHRLRGQRRRALDLPGRWDPYASTARATPSSVFPLMASVV